jgi:hypothetical protein
VGPEGGGEGGAGDGDAAAGEEGFELVDGSVDALAGRVFRQRQGAADARETHALVESQEQGAAVDAAEAGDELVEDGGERLPLGLWFFIGSSAGGGGGLGHGSRRLLVVSSPLVGVSGPHRGVSGHLEEPRRKGRVPEEGGGLAGEDDEDGLGDVLCEVAVADDAGGGGEDPVDVAADELGEGLL